MYDDTRVVRSAGHTTDKVVLHYCSFTCVCVFVFLITKYLWTDLDQIIRVVSRQSYLNAIRFWAYKR